MNRVTLGLAATSLLSFPLLAFSQETAPSRRVVVTASRVEDEISQVGSSVSVISGEEIQARGHVTVADLLDSLPGVEVVRSGPLGGNAVVFIRGANSEHTLVLIDGVEANDPISPNRAFNFADLPSDNIERIEVLRGPQSTLYGSDALGGVIAIFTKTGKGAPSLNASFEGGSYSTFTERVAAGGGDKKFNYSLGAQRVDSNGISAADRRDGNSEADGYSNTSLSGKIGASLSEELALNASLRFDHGDADLDNFGGVGGDDPNRKLKRDQLFSRIEAKANFFEKRLQQTFGIGFSQQSFDDDNDPDAAHPRDVLRSEFSSRLLKFDLQNDIKATESLRFVLGAETEEERGDSSYFSDGDFGPFTDEFAQRSVRTNSLFVDSRWGADSGPALQAGLRYDHHETFGSHVSWRLAPFYSFSEQGTKLFSNIGSGFKAPSLFQLYSSYGNEDLSPEKSLGLDVGLSQSLLGRKLDVSVAYFWNKFTDLISFNPQTFISENIARARTQGIETSAEWHMSEVLSSKFAYTYTDTEDRDSGDSLLRRPRHKFSADAQYKPLQSLTLQAGLSLTGARFDNDFSSYPATRTRLGTYVLANVGATLSISRDVELFTRIENLFDREFQQVLGYGEPGLAGYAGIRVKL